MEVVTISLVGAASNTVIAPSSFNSSLMGDKGLGHSSRALSDLRGSVGVQWGLVVREPALSTNPPAAIWT